MTGPGPRDEDGSDGNDDSPGLDGDSRAHVNPDEELPTHAKQTLAQWERYVAALTEDALWDNAERANTAAFVGALQGHGYDASEVHAILALFARQLKARGLDAPRGGYVDLEWLADDARAP